jgi:hypothetical protein
MRFLILALICFTSSACNRENNVAVRGIDFRETDNSSTDKIDFEAIVSIGDLKLPNTNAPIMFDQNQKMGELTTEQLKDGTSRLAATIDLEKLPKINSSKTALLPNSREIPISLSSLSQVHEFQIFENSRIYLGGSKKDSLLIGFAFNIPAFDHILTNDQQTLNLFGDFQFSASIFGSAGIFTSPEKGKNGIAIFAKKDFTIHKNQTRVPASFDPANLETPNTLSLLQLNYLFTKKGTLRIK